MNRRLSLTLTTIPAVFLLSSCVFLARADQDVSSSFGGNALLEIKSGEPAFLDGRIVIDPASAELAITKPVGEFDMMGATPVEGSVEYLGQSGVVRAASWQELVDGALNDCLGWFSNGSASWGCTQGAHLSDTPMVEYTVDCNSNGFVQLTLLSLDDRVAGIKVDMVDGTSTIAADPGGLGMVAMTVGGRPASGVAQTADGVVYAMPFLDGMVLCPVNP